MRHADKGEAERPDGERLGGIDDLQRHPVGDALLLQLSADQPGGEGGGVERHAQILGEVGQRADVILMPVRQHDADQIVEAFLDEGQVGQDHVDAGIARVRKGDAAVDHHPFALAAIQIDVHADLAGAAERAEQKFVLGSH